MGDLDRMKTITICNQKGGVAKTTTAAIIAAGLSLRGFSVLALDLDPQYSLTSICCEEYRYTIADVIEGRAPFVRAITETGQGFSIVPGDLRFSGDTLSFSLETIKKLLRTVSKDYDFCIIDTPPALSINTISALIASDYCIIPAKPDIMSYNGLMQLNQTIEAVNNKYGVPAVLGILLTPYDAGAPLDRSMLEAFTAAADTFGTTVFRSTVRSSRYIGKTQLWKESIFSFRPRSAIAQDCNNLIDEIIERIDNDK